MITYSKGDILKADAEALVNTVNCVGVMGRGIALQFKKQFEENYKAYKKVCDAGELRLGQMFVYDYGSFINPRYIVNFPTKDHWRSKSKLEDIESGLASLIEEVRARKIKSIAIPPLGCGLGGLNWDDVKQLIEEAFSNVSDVELLLYEPGLSPSEKSIAKSSKVPNMTRDRAALIALIRGYLNAAMDPFVSLLEVHKLMYFFDAVRQSNDKLQFIRAHYGPYAQNLRFLLNVTEGYFTKGYDGEDNPDKPIELLDGATESAKSFLNEDSESKSDLEKVRKIIEGFETPFGMELLATVHWVNSKEKAKSSSEAVTTIKSWSDRKASLFSDSHINLAWKVLESHGLLGTQAK